MNTLSVLHIFHKYLVETENWAYNLINCTPGTNKIIAAHEMLDNNFLVNKFKYIKPKHKRVPPLPSKQLNRIAASINFRIECNYAKYVKKAAQDMKIDLIHSHFGTTGWIYQSVAEALSVPHIVSFYGVDYTALPTTSPEWRTRYANLFNSAKMIITEGQQASEKIESLGCPRHKIAVCRLGIDFSRVKTKRKQKEINSLKLLQIARITEKKGLIHTLNAFNLAAVDCPDMTLTIVGSGDKSILEELMYRSRTGPASDRITFIDRINYSDLHNYLTNYDVFMHPSCTANNGDAEGGAPVVLIDAHATGMPVISTLHCDIPSIVVDGKSGILTREADVQALSRAITRFYHMNSAEYHDFSAAAQCAVRERYDISKNACELRKLYDQVLE